jgi:hypothetical protein
MIAPATIARPRVSDLAWASSSSIAAWSCVGNRRGGAGWYTCGGRQSAGGAEVRGGPAYPEP